MWWWQPVTKTRTAKLWLPVLLVSRGCSRHLSKNMHELSMFPDTSGGSDMSLLLVGFSEADATWDAGSWNDYETGCFSDDNQWSWNGSQAYLENWVVLSGVFRVVPLQETSSYGAARPSKLWQVQVGKTQLRRDESDQSVLTDRQRQLFKHLKCVTCFIFYQCMHLWVKVWVRFLHK